VYIELQPMRAIITGKGASGAVWGTRPEVPKWRQSGRTGFFGHGEDRVPVVGVEGREAERDGISGKVTAFEPFPATPAGVRWRPAPGPTGAGSRPGCSGPDGISSSSLSASPGDFPAALAGTRLGPEQSWLGCRSECAGATSRSRSCPLWGPGAGRHRLRRVAGKVEAGHFPENPVPLASRPSHTDHWTGPRRGREAGTPLCLHFAPRAGAPDGPDAPLPVMIALMGCNSDVHAADLLYSRVPQVPQASRSHWPREASLMPYLPRTARLRLGTAPLVHRDRQAHPPVRPVPPQRLGLFHR